MRICFLFFLALCGLTQAADIRAVILPVIDLRSLPIAASNTFEFDNLQQTQLLYGECVNVYAEEKGWLQVTVPGQLQLNGSNFVPYPGWIESSQVVSVGPEYNCSFTTSVIANELSVTVYSRPCLGPGCTVADILFSVSMGTRFQTGPSPSIGNFVSVTLPTKQTGWVNAAFVNIAPYATKVNKNLVPAIVNVAYQLLGWVYFWGGRSAYNPYSVQATGVDCSGLVGISHQANGVILPRDAHGQYVASNHGPTNPIYTGSLFFFADRTGHVTHVMLYVGDGYLIESTTSPGMNGTVLNSVEDRLGVTVDKLVYGQSVGGSTLWWGDFF